MTATDSPPDAPSAAGTDPGGGSTGTAARKSLAGLAVLAGGIVGALANAGTVYDFVTAHLTRSSAIGLTCVVLVGGSIWGLRDLHVRHARRSGRLIVVLTGALVAGAVGITAVAAVELRDSVPGAPVPVAAAPSAAAAPGFSAEGIGLDQRTSVPRCNAEISGTAPAGDAAVWVAHAERVAGARSPDRYFFTRAERRDTGSTEWSATLTVGDDPGSEGAQAPEREYEFFAFVATTEGDAFLGGRGYVDEDEVTGLVYFDRLPPGVSTGNRMVASRQAGEGGPCPR
jgi:hypothetical protein